MSKRASTSEAEDISEIKREQLGQGVRGKHFAKFSVGSNVVVLNPEMHRAFPTSEAVNKALSDLLAMTRETVSMTARAERRDKARQKGCGALYGLSIEWRRVFG